MTQNQFKMEDLSMHVKTIKMCRLCLSIDGTLIDLFLFSSELESLIADAVTKCTSVHVAKHSQLPSGICEACYVQLIKTQKFQMQAVKSDEILRVYLQRSHDDDDKQSILGSSVMLPVNDENCSLETNVANQDNEEYSTNYEETEPCIKYYESDCEEPEMNITLDSKSHMDWHVHSSRKDSTFDPNLVIKSELIINEKEDQFDIDTEVLNDFEVSQKIIKSENEVSNDTTMASYECNVCNKCFSNSDILRKHHCIQIGEKSYQCNICNKGFSNSGILRKHRCIHTGEKPYQCGVCNKSFRKLDYLRNHHRRHTGDKPSQCDVCNKSFSNSANLKRHQRAHTGEMPYQCDVCNRCFSNSVNLRKHHRRHTGEMPYQCDVCNKFFNKSSAFIIHQRAHTGEKPYRCDVCNKCFTISANLRRHQRVHTREKS